jgi:sugar lactone lactonase YvrE
MQLCTRATLQSLRARFSRAGRPQSQTIVRGCLVFAALPVFAALMGCWGWGNGVVFVGSGANNNNALWVANGTDVAEFLPSQLKSGSSDPAPHLTLHSAVLTNVQGVTFDGHGNLWVVDGGTVSTGGTVVPSIFEFSVSQISHLSTTNNPTPAITIQSASFVSPKQAAFDQQGNLWVTDSGSNAVYFFARSALSTNATSATPTATVSSNPAFNGPIGIAFNDDGNLYVSNNVGDNIYGFNLNVGNNVVTAGGAVTLTPSVTLTNDGSGSIQSPWGLAVDGRNNLWSSNSSSGGTALGTVVEFSRTQLAANGDPTPNITLSSIAVNSNQTLVAPNGIAFDSSGDLVVDSSAAPFGIAGFTQSQLVTGMTSGPTPDVFLVGGSTTLSAPAGVTFGPVIE